MNRNVHSIKPIKPETCSNKLNKKHEYGSKFYCRVENKLIESSNFTKHAKGKFITTHLESLNTKTKLYSKEKAAEPLLRKSKIPKAKYWTDKAKITFSELKNAKINTQEIANTVLPKKSLQFICDDTPLQMPSNQELLSIAMNYKRITSDYNKIGIEKHSYKLDYDPKRSDKLLFCSSNINKKYKSIFCKNHKCLSVKNHIERISENSKSEFYVDNNLCLSKNKQMADDSMNVNTAFGILRILSIFTLNKLKDNEPMKCIDYLRQQFLGPTIIESMMTLFEGINYLTSSAHTMKAPTHV